jgi:hypothetical protein
VEDVIDTVVRSKRLTARAIAALDVLPADRAASVAAEESFNFSNDAERERDEADAQATRTAELVSPPCQRRLNDKRISGVG